ncbi:MAG: HAD hydrolase family protein, partial [Clostridiales bacterium]|nr:HAD hydrolase family protein [Clostridiales bacterium]
CGLGVAMGNAIDKVKAVADVIAPANEEDGVASVIEQLKGQKYG